MKPKKHATPEIETPAKDTSPKVPQREKINFELKIKELPWSDKQKELFELIGRKDTKYVFIIGPSGVAKTICAVYSALKALNQKQIGEIIYIRQPVESSKFSLGFLKGDSSEKLLPYALPLYDKLNELLTKPEVAKLEKDERFEICPIGHLRGRSFNANFLIFDEAQNGNTEDFLLAMSRMGKFSKMIISGDTMQSDIKGSALERVAAHFDNEESRAKGIYVFRFGKEDIFRNEILSYVIEKFESLK